MIIHDFPQYSPEWWEIRRGVPTASDADRIITPKTGKLSASHEKYIHKLIADRVRFDPNMLTERPMSAAMRHGVECEPTARDWYSFDTGLEVRQVGFCMTDDKRFGFSPDGLVSTEGVLELKCPQPETHVGYILGGILPDEYRCQCHFALACSELPWLDFVSYAEGFDPFKIRVVPDEFTAKMRAVMNEFYGLYEQAWTLFQERGNHVLPQV
jgi:hypothetical protein